VPTSQRQRPRPPPSPLLPTTTEDAGFLDEYDQQQQQPEDYAEEEDSRSDDDAPAGDYASLLGGGGSSTAEGRRTGAASGRRAPPPTRATPAAPWCEQGGDAGARPRLSGGVPDCDLRAEGFDAAGGAALLRRPAGGGGSGGIDGLYVLAGCDAGGRPFYLRRKSQVEKDEEEVGGRRRAQRRRGRRRRRSLAAAAAAADDKAAAADHDRILWYSASFGDWDISNGTAASERDLLAFGKGRGGGGDDDAALSSPLLVAKWHLGLDLADPASPDVRGVRDDDPLDDFWPVSGARVVCADGRAVAGATPHPTPSRLTDGQQPTPAFRPSLPPVTLPASLTLSVPSVSTGFATGLLIAGLLAVATLPWALSARRAAVAARAAALRGRSPAAGGGTYSEVPQVDDGGNVALVTMMQQSRKREAGHEL
jgi:hypothetical protein